jgi:hypothetical protein
MQDNNNASAKDQFVKWLDKYVKSDKEQAKDLHNNFISVIKDATNRAIAQIKYTGEVQPITSEDYNQLIDEYIKQVSEFIVIDFSSYTLADFKNVIQIFNSQYLIMYMYQIRTKALDLYIKDIREQHTLKVLNTLADLQNQEILKNTDYKTFIYTDLEELISKYNLNCIIDKSALLQVQQSLKKDAENLSESERQKFLAGDTLKLTDSDNTYNLKMLFTILVMEYQKPFTEDLINRDFKANKDYYKTRHQKLQKLDTLLKQATKKMEATEQFIKDNQKTDTAYATNNIAKNYNYIDNRADKLITSITNKKSQLIDLALDTPNKRHRQRIQTPIVITIDINNELVIEDDKRINAIDRLVINRAFSIWQVNKTHIDAELIYKDIKGEYTESNRIGKDLYDKINNSIDKLRTSSMIINIENADTIQRLGLDTENIEAIKKESYILPLNKTEIKYKNGVVKSSYEYIQEPVYFTLAKTVGQIKSIPRDYMLLNEPANSKQQTQKTTTATVLIDDTLARHIELIKSTKNNPNFKNANILLYDTILNECELLKDIEPGTSKYKTYKHRYTQYIDAKIKDYKKRHLIKNYVYYPNNENTKRVKGYIIYV